MALNFHNDALTLILNILHRATAKPDNAKYMVCISDNGTLTATSAKGEILASELAATNGYDVRKPMSWASDATFNATELRGELPASSVEWTVNTAAVTYQTVFVIANGSASSNVGIDAGTAITGNNVTLNAHGLTSGDEIMLTADAGGTLPGTVNGTTVYRAIVSDANTFQISNDGIVPIDLSGAAGNLRLRYAEGTVWVIDPLTNPETRQVGQRIAIDLQLAIARAVFGSGI